MKTIKQIREEYDSIVLDQVQNAPDELMLEGRESAIKASPKAIPSPSEMPTMLMFRRIAYRTYPNKQTVALYYSKYVNKYLSIPFGPDGNLNLSEAVVHDTLEEGVIKTIAKTAGGALKGAAHGAVRGAAIGRIASEPGFALGGVIGAGIGAIKGAKKAYDKTKEKDMNEDWQSVNRKDKTDGLSQAAVNAYRRENPGSKLKTAVTEKNPTGKRAARRKSFCSRMGGMKKRLTSAKTARDPDSRINKALRRWNCEESFRSKLATLREERQEQVNEFVGALRLAAPAARAVAPYVPKVLDKVKDVASKVVKINPKEVARDASAILKSAKKPKAPKTPKAPKSGDAASKVDTATDIASAIKDLASKTKSSPPEASSGEPAMIRRRGDLIASKTGTKGKSSRDFGPRSDLSPTQQSRYTSALLAKENKISDIQNMINEGVETMDLSINGRSITLNNSMAKKIIRVYESVNTKNKKIVESMLNEDLDSFKKLLNFSIKA